MTESETKSPTSSIKWAVFLLVIIAGLQIVSLFVQSQRQTWEYTITSPSDYLFEEELDTLGKDGWELVFARRARDSTTERMSYEMIFKRPKVIYYANRSDR